MTDLVTRAFVGGDYVDAVGGETFACVNPATGRVIAQVASCDADDVDRAVRSAKSAFESGVWARSAPKWRKSVLLRLAELVTEHAEELAMLETLDMGKPISDRGSFSSPFGGFRQSGYGRDKSLHALDKYTDLKAVWIHLR